jgi:hypothetical protein
MGKTVPSAFVTLLLLPVLCDFEETSNDSVHAQGEGASKVLDIFGRISLHGSLKMNFLGINFLPGQGG